MSKGISPHQIQAFRLVMRHGSMTAAASELNTSQPSVSRLIRELEQTTGLTLFLRKSGKLQATSAAVAFHREVELSFIGLDQLLQSARDIACFGSGRLNIVSSPIMAISVLPAVVKEFKKKQPDALVSFDMRSETTIQRWTSSGYCDLGFSTSAPDTIGLRVEPLYRVPGLCVMPVGHPLAAKKEVSVTDISKYPLILPSYTGTIRAPLERAFREAGVDWTASTETSYGITVCALVNDGVGVGIANPLAVQQSYGNVIFRPFTPDIVFRGYMLLQEDRWSDSLVQLFYRLTRARISEMLSHLRSSA